MSNSPLKILVLDNFDSFVYNLVQYVGEQGAEPIVVRNDQISTSQALEMKPDGVLLSPGPGQPTDAGVMCDLIRAFAEQAPIFGVCLGHQAIGQVFGAKIIRSPELQHGKTSEISHNKSGIFKDIDSPIRATRYHSLVIDPATLPNELEITASTKDGIIMGVRHRSKNIEGVQFHPESILTEHGHHMIRNFIERCKK